MNPQPADDSGGASRTRNVERSYTRAVFLVPALALFVFLFGWWVGGTDEQRVLSIEIPSQGTSHTWVFPFALMRSKQGVSEPLVRSPIVAEISYRQERVRSETATNADGRSVFVFPFLDPPRPGEPVRLRVRAADETILFDRWIAHPLQGEPTAETRAPLRGRFSGDPSITFDVFAEPTFQTIRPTRIWIERMRSDKRRSEQALREPARDDQSTGENSDDVSLRVMSVSGNELTVTRDSIRVCDDNHIEFSVTPIGLHPSVQIVVAHNIASQDRSQARNAGSQDAAPISEALAIFEALIPFDASTPALDVGPIAADAWFPVSITQPNEREHSAIYIYNERGIVFTENVFFTKRDGYFRSEVLLPPLARGPHWFFVSPDPPWSASSNTAARRVNVGRPPSCAFAEEAWQRPATRMPDRIESNAEDISTKIWWRRTLGRGVATLGLVLGALGEWWLLRRSLRNQPRANESDSHGSKPRRYEFIVIAGLISLGFLLLALLVWSG